jgi:predicted AAA+ superfamily ATPase
MDDNTALTRIAQLLEAMLPPAPAATDWLSAPAYVWSGAGARPVARLEAPALALLRGIDAQKELVVSNVHRLAAGHAAHDMLLWGARGMGKSALLRSSIADAQGQAPGSIALVQVAPEALPTLAALFAALGAVDRRFLVFIDDLGFEDNDGSGPRALRSWLEGGVEARPRNARLAVTSNRRAIVARHASEQDDPLNPRDAVDDRLALADRFGLSIGFHNCDQVAYLAIIAGYAASLGLEWHEGDALEWSKRRGARSGRVAWHYITELAGRAGKEI